MEGVNIWLAELKPPRAKKEEGRQDEEIIMRDGNKLRCRNVCNFRQASQDEEEDEKSARLSQMFAGKVRRLARTIPAANEMAIHTNGMHGIVH